VKSCDPQTIGADGEIGEHAEITLNFQAFLTRLRIVVFARKGR
jgi:hypothetical protein